MAPDHATRPLGAVPEVSARGKAPWLGFAVRLLHPVARVLVVPHHRGGGGWSVSRTGQGSGCEGRSRCSAAPRDAWVLGTVALAWRPAVCREGIYHGHEHGIHHGRGHDIHHRHGCGICHGHKQGICHGHGHGMAVDTTSAMGMEVASTYGHRSSRHHHHTRGIAASSPDSPLPSRLGSAGSTTAPKPLNKTI